VLGACFVHRRSGTSAVPAVERTGLSGLQLRPRSYDVQTELACNLRGIVYHISRKGKADFSVPFLAPFSPRARLP